MKLISALILMFLSVASAHAEQGDAEDRVLIQQYSARADALAPIEQHATSLKKNDTPVDQAASSVEVAR